MQNEALLASFITLEFPPNFQFSSFKNSVDYRHTEMQGQTYRQYSVQFAQQDERMFLPSSVLPVCKDTKEAVKKLTI